MLPTSVERRWLFASSVGFLLDVLLYHTFSTFLRAVMRFMASVITGTDRSTLASGAVAKSLQAAGCSFSALYH